MIRDPADWRGRAATVSQCGGNVKRNDLEVPAPRVVANPRRLCGLDFQINDQKTISVGAEKRHTRRVRSPTKFGRSDPGSRGGPGLPAEPRREAPAGFQSAVPSSL